MSAQPETRKIESGGSVNILGVEVTCLNLASILARVAEWSGQTEPRSVFYANAHCLNLAFNDSGYREALRKADLIYADGISVVWASRFLGGCRLQKMTGADWIEDFAGWAGRIQVNELDRLSDLRIYVLAGRPGVARQAVANLCRRHPQLNVAGLSDGFFQEKSQAEVLEEISVTKPHIVFVGLGSPLQEKWIASNRDKIQAPVCWGVGALFDYLAGIEPRVPPWLYSLGLEWFWRFLVNPGDKWRRYLIGNPVFVYRVLRQKLTGIQV